MPQFMRTERCALVPVLLLIPVVYPTDTSFKDSQADKIQIIKNESGPLNDGPLFEFVPDLVLGIDEGRPTWQMFGRAAGVWDESPDNRLFIGTSCLVTYITTLSGQLIGQFGGYGSGPGEFQVPTGNFWIEEDQEIWIYDSRLIRLTRYSADGQLIGTLSCEAQAKQWQSLIHLRDKRFLGSRTEYENGELYTRYGILDDQLNWDRTVISRLNRPTATYSPRDGLEIPIPYQPGCWVIAFPDGRFVHGRADIGRLDYYSVDGEALFWVEDCWEFPRVTQDDRNRWLDRIESRRPEELPAARSSRLPDRHGAFGRAVTDESGRLWLTRAKPTYSSENNREYVYDFFGPDGIWLGTQVLTFPPNQISIRGDYLYWNDQGGEEYGPRIRRYRIKQLYLDLN